LRYDHFEVEVGADGFPIDRIGSLRRLPDLERHYRKVKRRTGQYCVSARRQSHAAEAQNF
jgi:hypothetical protein